jgi:hypothetical protein
MCAALDSLMSTVRAVRGLTAIGWRNFYANLPSCLGYLLVFADDDGDPLSFREFVSAQRSQDERPLHLSACQ